MTATNQTLLLASPCIVASESAYPAVVANLRSELASCDIQLGNDVVPFDPPVSLPSGVVIDLRYCSSNIQSLAGANLPVGSSSPNADVMLSPQGTVSGAVGGSGSLLFVLRDLSDATSGLDPSSPACKGECYIISVNPASGAIETFDADLTSGNLFTFAMAGSRAAR